MCTLMHACISLHTYSSNAVRMVYVNHLYLDEVHGYIHMSTPCGSDLEGAVFRL